MAISLGLQGPPCEMNALFAIVYLPTSQRLLARVLPTSGITPQREVEARLGNEWFQSGWEEFQPGQEHMAMHTPQ